MRDTQPRCLISSVIKNRKRARKEGVERTTRLHNYQIEILIVLASRELFKSGYNQEVVDTVMALLDIYKKGFFDNDNSS